MAFSKEYLEKKNEVENYLSALSASVDGYPERLSSAVTYSFTSGGKRLRPILFLEAYRLFGGEVNESAVKFMQAIECIHTYSLIHDDLPCMDNDDYRRGKLTCHKVYGEANAVLAGDALLNLAYELMLEAVALSLNSERATQAARLIASACGGSGLIGGQTLDLEPEQNTNANRLMYIYQHKTGDLISASMMAGGIMAGATREEVALLKGYGDYFGLSFQIKDDILDAEEKNDVAKNTYVHIFGLTNAKITLGDCIDKAISHIVRLNKDVDFLKKLALKSADRKE